MYFTSIFDCIYLLSPSVFHFPSLALIPCITIEDCVSVSTPRTAKLNTTMCVCTTAEFFRTGCSYIATPYSTQHSNSPY